MKRLIGIAVAAILLGGAPDLLRAATASEPVTFRLNVNGELETIDPHLATTVDAGNVCMQLWEGLVIIDPNNDAKVRPGVAKRWEFSADKKTITFYLREDAKWSDGTPLDAYDFVYSWRRAADPQTASPQVSRYDYIKNGKKYYTGIVKDPNQLGFKALGPYTFQVELEAPLPVILQLFAKSTFAPVKKDVIAKYGDKWTLPENIVSNGPFMLTDRRLYDRLVYKKNPHYWNAKTVNLDEVIAYVVDDPETGFKRYRTSDFDFIRGLPVEKVPVLIATKDPEHRMRPLFGSYYYALNVKEPALSDKRVRQALAFAIDREAIVKEVVRGGQIPATGHLPPNIEGYAYKKYVYFDPKKAQKLLAEAGYPEGKGFPNVTLSYNTQEGHRKIAEAIQQMWKKNLGIDVAIQNYEWKVHVANMHNHNFQIGRMGGIGEYVYPTTFFEGNVSTAPGNYSQFSTPENDALWEEAMREADPKKKLALYRKMEDIWMDAMPEIPIYFYMTHWMQKPYVKGLVVNSGDAFLLQDVKIEKK